ncbi:non-homologous end-joining DNA ligase [Tuberibacillus sp. Marseille-P3662]|uniref:non-homologous end-joining DNA ligase n=1 Tax=Tuberibacillus sp. Marseille-P3662 TaxID=1965358 RepID=UPI000A1C7F64|nr:non-homologous end-joining DNA ligase [Tuberibacillus sp. Marseille-P3662]
MNDPDQTVRIGKQTVSLTSLDKPLWPEQGLKKADFIKYIHVVADKMLPFLNDRPLTVVRYPHGVKGESFFQKNCPDYAPDFVKTATVEDIDYILCSDQPTLIWLANQLAFEYHVPFQPITSASPSEIVLDLDPPSRDEFPMAIQAALMIKDVLDRLHLTAFIKTSGNKGLQVYIPLPDETFTYDDTRDFTQFIASYLTESEPDWFTTERLKKNRHHRLYVDYLQHDEGKTIIAPYSVRGNAQATVATPIHWDEVNDDLEPDTFTIPMMEERLKQRGCPMALFQKAKQEQNFGQVLQALKDQQKGGTLTK